MAEAGLIDPPPPVDTPPELTEEELRRQLQLQVVDASSAVQAESADNADEYLRQQSSERGVKGFLKKIWFGNLARDYVRQKRIQSTSKQIIRENNVYAATSDSRDDHNGAMAATIERVTSEYDLLHHGETNQEASEIAGGEPLENRLKELVSQFARGDIDGDTLNTEKNRALNHFGIERRDSERKKGQILADNVVAVARNAKAAIEHGISIDEIDAALGLKIADVKLGVRTQASREAVDRIVEKINGTKVGSVVNETTIATAVAIVMGATKFTVRKVISAVGATIGIGVGTATIAGVREAHHVTQERRLHNRQMAEGGQLDVDTKRRQQMEETRYETVSADTLTENLRNVQDRDDLDVTDLIQTITEAQARIDMSDEQGIDLITYGSKTTVEQQRLDLDVELARAKARLVRLTEAGTTTDDVVEQASHLAIEHIEGDISDKDKQFRKLQAKRALAAAAIGFTVGAGIGLASQEIHSLVDSSLQGVFQNKPDANRVTELSGIFHNQQHTVVSEHHAADFAASAYHSGNNALDLPHGYSFNADHALIGPGGKVIAENIQFGENGELTKSSVDILTKDGFKLNVSHQAFTTSTVENSTQQVSAGSYVDTHPQEFTNMQRNIWYDNNSPVPVDNQLETWWGGQGGSGIDANGNFVFDVNHMTPTGTFQGGLSANPYDLLNNHQLALAISVDQAHQNQVIMIPFNSDGSVTINAHDPVLSSVFTNQNGHAVFNGAYAEVVQINSQTPQLTNVNILSTVVGSNTPRTVTESIQNVVHTSGEHVITHIEAPTAESLPIEVAPVVPIIPRSGMEDLQQGRAGGNGYESYGYYYGGYGKAYESRWAAERSPRLRRNPNAVLDTGEELDWYRKEQQRRVGQEYVSEIDSYIDGSDVLGQIDDNTKAIVCIPVAAASEADNIYHTLSLFSGQDDDAKQSSLILLNVNWPETVSDDPEAMARVQKTLSEIERAKADFPDVKIASFEKVWSGDFIQSKQQVVDGKVKSGIYGTVIKVLYDTAALAMEKAVRDGRRQTSSESILITNDADTLGMSRHYLRNYILAMESRYETDLFSGTIRRGTESYRDYPGYGVASNFFAVLNMMNNRFHNRHRGDSNGGFTTEGPNSAVRMSAYAAVGGVEDRIGAGADAVLGQRISAARYAPPKPSILQRVRKVDNRTTRPIAGYVTAAQIDTLPDRLLGAYKRGEWIARGWDGFDDGDGYEDRTASLSDSDLVENPETDMDAIARRIEVSVEGFASNWYRDPATVSAALALCFGIDSPADPLYTYNWDGRPGWNGDGQFHFKFTEKGKETLKNRLLRDKNGRFDPFGTRLTRQLYSRTNPRTSRTPLAESRLLG